jgi:hypothetical protein
MEPKGFTFSSHLTLSNLLELLAEFLSLVLAAPAPGKQVLTFYLSLKVVTVFL